jgi:hypothetical protein
LTKKTTKWDHGTNLIKSDNPLTMKKCTPPRLIETVLPKLTERELRNWLARLKGDIVLTHTCKKNEVRPQNNKMKKLNIQLCNAKRKGKTRRNENLCNQQSNSMITFLRPFLSFRSHPSKQFESLQMFPALPAHQKR